ncbi:MAG: ATP-binding protein [Oscillospiraceae bacterium]|jgi:DNA replication protein DnaC|nr:ATP-binding protein [Oscillospiraceae bacterium]MBQ2383631.1 ATP-binding protein [Oscillospiraceae bacterium]
MAYSIEVIQRAKDRLAQAKADRESQYGRRLAEAYAQIPRLKEIDLQLRHSMALAARNVFAGGGQVREAMDKIRQENLSLQQERAALIEAHFGPGYLDEVPVCDRCGGSGYVGANMCGCLMELCRQEQRKELTFLSVGNEDFQQFRLDYYPDRTDPQQGVNIRRVMERTFEVCRRYAFEFSSKSGNLLFSGGTGLGKTFLSACIARTVADRGYSVMYESAGHLFARMERAKFSGDEEARREAEKYTACDLLIIDDLGTEMGGQFTTAALYGLINDRILSGKATIISTNLNTGDLEKRYSPAIASRLRGEFTRLAFLGEDIRLKKSRGL